MPQKNGETLMIGFVRCKECGVEWEALCYADTLHILECPECGAQNSEVVEGEQHE